MNIAIASDHAGYTLKTELAERLRKAGHAVTDLGGSADRSDYPSAGAAVGRAVASGQVERGVLVCGSGIGVSIAANKVKGVRATVVSEPVSARLCREHNDCNVIAVGERLIGPEMAWVCVETFLNTPAATEGRHATRVQQIAELERN